MESNENSENREPEQAANERTRRQVTRVYSKYVLPSERHPFPVHFDILRRFVMRSRSGSEAVPAPKVEGEGIPIQAAEMNVRFLRSIGLLSAAERGMYLPTPEAIKFVNAKTVSDERAKPILKALVANSWFAEAARSVLSTQPLIGEDQFLGELALVAETDKSRKGPALRVLLDYLVYTGLVNRDERGISLGDGGPVQTQTTEAATPQAEVGVPKITSAEAPGWHIVQTEDFYVKVRSDADALADLRDQLDLLEKKVARLRAKRDSEVIPP